MRTPPKLAYSGLTVIIDEASRFDKDFSRLLSGPVRDWFDRDCLIPPYSLDSSDLRDINCLDPILPNTKAFLLGGEKVAEKYARAFIDPPGYTAVAFGRPALPIFYPQDCCDHKNYRGVSDDDETPDSDRDTKESTPTRRKNYRFWNQWHIRKFLLGNTPSAPALDAIVYPRLEHVITLLNQTRDEDLYLDIETSRVHRCLSCIGFSTSSSFPRVYVVPVYLSTGDLAYREFVGFHRALSLALARNQVVIHNASFDLLVLHGFYKMCLPSHVYDTMIAQHRCFPEAEKALGHAISAWTNQPYHKDFSTEVHSHDQEQRLWQYNARDVFNLKLIKDAQLSYAAKDPGLLASISQGNDSIIPYLVTSITGLRLDTLTLSRTQMELTRKRELFARIASILVGAPFNPASSKQCADFFHKKLSYPVVSRTSQGAPALGSKQLFQLQLKHANPLIPVILKYREAAKDASSLESELFVLP